MTEHDLGKPHAQSTLVVQGGELESLEWGLRTWADFCKCSEGNVQKTAAWKRIMLARAEAKSRANPERSPAALTGERSPTFR